MWRNDLVKHTGPFPALCHRMAWDFSVVCPREFLQCCFLLCTLGLQDKHVDHLSQTFL